MSRHGRLRALLFGALGLATSFASAQTCNTSATPTAFGTYNPLSPLAVTTTGTVNVSCSALISLLVNYTITLSAGSSGTYAARTMASGGNHLTYNLFTDTAHTTIWGDGSGGTGTVTDGYLLQVLFPVSRNYSVYGRLSALQNVAPGTYADTIFVTVTY